MHFLDRFDDASRARFEQAGTPVDLRRGDLLVRRGEPGGDMFLLEEGTLEVVASEPSGDRIVAVLEPGAVVGEVSFLDEAPRTADVRARTQVRALRWARADLQDLLRRDTPLAASLMEQLARIMAERMRASGRPSSRSPNDWPTTTLGLVEEVHAAADQAKEQLDRAATLLRDRADDGKAAQIIDKAMRVLGTELDDLVASRPHPDALAQAIARLRRELRPWLARSTVARLLLHHDATAVVRPALLHHVHAGDAVGEGMLGTQLDRWLLDSPTVRARREAEAAWTLLCEGITGRVLLLDTPTASRVRRLAELARPLTILDPSHTVLADARNAAPAAPIVTVQESALRVALGRSDEALPKQQLVAVFDLLSYLPDRLAVPLLAHARRMLAPGGRIVLSAVDDADDTGLVEHLLGWPTVRRSATKLERLALRVGLVVERRATTTAPTVCMTLVESP